MVKTERSILFGAADSEAVFRFEEILRQQLVRFERMANGPQVIERALFERYDAIVLDFSLTLLAPKQVQDLLRTNPRTRNIPVYLIDLTGGSDNSSDFIQQPHSDLSWLGAVLPTLADMSDDGHVSADLREVQLPDMLQMLLQNQRTGIVEIESQGRLATIEVAESGFGKIQVEQHEGLKALARIVVWKNGTFMFRPQASLTVLPEGDAFTLLLDAVRLSDEAEHLRQQIPPGSRLVVSGHRDDSPEEAILDEVLMLVDFYGSVDDILERVALADADVLAAILRLQVDNWVEVQLPANGQTDGSGAWPNIPVPRSHHDNDHPIVWVLGADADYVRVLWSDSRLQERVLARKSLRNVGRFGGNGWLIDLGGNRFVWCRFMLPTDVFPDFALREDLTHAGLILIHSQLNEQDLQSMSQSVSVLGEIGLPAVWLPLMQEGQAAEREEIVSLDHVAGVILEEDQDSPGLFWKALETIFGSH